MIVLSRKKNESIVINSDIQITVVEIRGDKVRLGIIAPVNVPVHRQEVWDAIHGSVRQPAREAGQSVGQFSVVEISVDQLVHELGATEAEIARTTRFTNEGGIDFLENPL